MFIHTTGQVGVELLNIGSVRIDIMNKTEGTSQVANVLLFNTGVSPKTLIASDTILIPPSSGDSVTFTPSVFPTSYEVVVRTNDQKVIPYISGINLLQATVVPSVTFKYGDLFVYEHPGTVQSS
ncbi:hypothetical protein JMM81_07830 [Bacillus sp. V3B]|uniref:hypothetical protein n=1 Tax=Bacillus sp. V3B TaxID=2804915 RepID=UPI00210EFF62|nr:hypothetical protein [Bacillus sp. V3B]MCQ6274873.1 hypothetical protein [Bacillus sp. V3B]